MTQEIWKTVYGFSDYKISSSGEVRRVVPDRRNHTCRRINPYIDKKRYAYLTLYKDGEPHVVTVHRLVCETFHGPKPSAKHQVAHGDGMSLNNEYTNLRWATKKENEADKRIHGTYLSGDKSFSRNFPERLARGVTHGRHTKPESTARGEQNGMSVLTESNVTEIRLDPRPRKLIAADFGVSITMIGFIQRGISWAHVPMPNRNGFYKC